MKTHTYASKIANINIFMDDKIIYNIEFVHNDTYRFEPVDQSSNIYRELSQYFAGNLVKFTLPTIINGSEFETKVLRVIQSIPYGEKWSYKQVAEAAGYPKAYRAVGTVCKNNKLPILIPCHRVIKSNGQLGDYSGGIDIKKYLLELENNYKKS